MLKASNNLSEETYFEYIYIYLKKLLTESERVCDIEKNI